MDERLVDILACPKCRQKVYIDETGVICKPCGLSFSIVKNSGKDVPIMLLSEAVNV